MTDTIRRNPDGTFAEHPEIGTARRLTNNLRAAIAADTPPVSSDHAEPPMTFTVDTPMNLTEATQAAGYGDEKSRFAADLLTRKFGRASGDLVAEAMDYLADDANRQAERKMSAAQREKKPSMEGGRFPIETVEDLRNAISSYGRAKDEDKPAVRRWIRKRARELDQTSLIPDSWDDGKTDDADETKRSTIRPAVRNQPFTEAYDPDVAVRDENGHYIPKDDDKPKPVSVDEALTALAAATSMQRTDRTYRVPDAATASMIGAALSGRNEVPKSLVGADGTELPGDVLGAFLSGYRQPEDKAVVTDPVVDARTLLAAGGKVRGQSPESRKAYRVAHTALAHAVLNGDAPDDAFRAAVVALRAAASDADDDHAKRLRADADRLDKMVGVKA